MWLHLYSADSITLASFLFSIYFLLGPSPGNKLRSRREFYSLSIYSEYKIKKYIYIFFFAWLVQPVHLLLHSICMIRRNIM